MEAVPRLFNFRCLKSASLASAESNRSGTSNVPPKPPPRPPKPKRRPKSKRRVIARYSYYAVDDEELNLQPGGSTSMFAHPTLIANVVHVSR